MFGMNQNEPTPRLEGEIYPPEFIIKSMRDSGYRDTAHALAELIDNSVQAQAQDIEVICMEEPKRIRERIMSRIDSICVIDNGEGMTPETLRLALQFGKGTHLKDRRGIGRFGMGLPNSSISQCRRVEVWTWQNGYTNSVYSYLDVDEIEDGRLTLVPKPVLKQLPQGLEEQSNILGTTGTLVLWTKLDDHRISWRTARSTLNNTESLVGRIYRKYINDSELRIRLLSLVNGQEEDSRPARVNDPLYLMKNSSTPEPFGQEPMFQKWGERDQLFTFSVEGENHEVIVRASWARPETVSIAADGDRGSQPYGKHAAKNLGVSILRHGRELKIDDSWTNNYDPTDRWWGVEVDFPSALDEIFGVTNNKQDAVNFSKMSHYDWKDEAESGETLRDFKKRMSGEPDPKIKLLEIALYIKEQIKLINKKLKDQTKGRRSDRRHEELQIEVKATQKIQKRIKAGHETEYDKEEPTEENKGILISDLIRKGYSDDTSRRIADTTVERKLKVKFIRQHMHGYAFFEVEHVAGVTEVIFNQNHPFFDQLIEALEQPATDKDSDYDLIRRVKNASDTIKLLFHSWARYEEEEEASRRSELADIRQEWGKMARFFLTKDK